MLPIPNLIILAAFTATGTALTVIVFQFKKRGMTFLGRPSINPTVFYTGKISLFFSWGVLIYRCIVPTEGIFTAPTWLQWVAVALMAVSAFILIRSFFDLGAALKIGLPENETRLSTGGLYAFSRNPIYLSVFMVNLASCIFYPHPLNILCSGYGIFVHYLITLSEEKFLADRFGAEWEDYRKRVRRYL